MKLLEGLNQQQLEAVTTCDTHVRIIAGAGSGKTRVVTTRIAYLIEELGIPAYQILAITFTNKAAREMKERVNNLLGDNVGVNISTIHAFCVRVLREDIESLGYSRNFVILDSDDQKSILRDIYKEIDIDVKTITHNQALVYISNNKSALVDPTQASKMAFSEIDKLKNQIYELYEKRLQEMKALDFDDLLLFVHRLFKTNHLVLDKWQRRFQYIHVDEFQDVDELQYDIVKMLCGENSLLCVVGDPDQTIYTWRGANVQIIMDFTKDFNNAKSIVLNQNYRSTQNILTAANNVIKNNRNRLDKALFSENRSDELVTYYASNDEKFEAAWIAQQIRQLHDYQQIAYKDIAILYRSNYLSRGLEKAMLDANIPYRIYGGVKFFERAEVKDALSYLRLLVQDNDSYANLAIRRILNVPKRGVGPKSMDNIIARSKLTGMNLYEVLKCSDIASGKVKAKLDEFTTIIERARQKIEDGYTISLVLDELLEDAGYYQMLDDNHEVDRKENIAELIGDIQNFENNNDSITLEDYLQTISLYTDTDEEGQSGDVVQLMSVHSAKGLEFNHVFVYSMCEGVFPNERSVSEGGSEALEEERRLAYVAFTRAKEKLYLSSSSGYSYITNSNKTPSRFIEEIGEELLDRQGEMNFNTKVQPQFSANEQQYVQKINKGSLTSNKATTAKRHKLSQGDLVEHAKFGEGVVINVQDNIATIAFDKKVGMRRISINHPSLKRK